MPVLHNPFHKPKNWSLWMPVLHHPFHKPNNWSLWMPMLHHPFHKPKNWSLWMPVLYHPFLPRLYAMDYFLLLAKYVVELNILIFIA
jgi:hypothetical protein